MAARTLLALAALAAASSANAQTWPVCIDESAVPTPEAYVAVREAAWRFLQAGRFGAKVILGGPSDRGAAESLRAYTELLRAGVPPGYLEWGHATGSTGDCLSVTVEAVLPAQNPPGLWHLRGVYFGPGSADVESGAALAGVRIAAALYRPGETLVLLDGHSDTAGSTDRNLDLSRRRAEAVAHELVVEGVRWEDIVIRAHGETQLARPTPDGTPEPLNRRVWIDMRTRSAIPR